MEHFAQLPIIVVSTRDRPEDRLRGLKVGADAYLTKQSLDAGELVDLGAPAERAALGSLKSVIRVLLVDDSPSVRAVLRRFFSPHARHRGGRARPRTARRPCEAVLDVEPHVVVMDLQMPVMDGYTAIERIMAVRPTPIVVLSSRANRDQMQTAFEAIRRGALEVLPKPEDTASWQQLAESLPETVRAVAEAQARPEPRPSPAAVEPGALELPGDPAGLRWVAIGASTGGPAAIRELPRGGAGATRRSASSSCSTSPPASSSASPTGSTRSCRCDVRLARQDGEVPRPRRRAAGPGRRPPAAGARRRAAPRHRDPGAARPPPLGRRAVPLLRRELPARGRPACC